MMRRGVNVVCIVATLMSGAFASDTAHDAGTHDTGASDTAHDAGTHDAGASDTAHTDAGTHDAGAGDTAHTDAGTHDAGANDTAHTDADTHDAGASDTADEGAHAKMGLSPAVNVCNSGVMQSPINLKTCPATIEHEHFNIPDERPELSMAYASSMMELEKVCHKDHDKKDHGCELKMTPKSAGNIPDSNVLTVPGHGHERHYVLSHCVVRIPSEHTVDGRQFPLEVQCHHVMKHTLHKRKGILSTLYMVGKGTSSGFLDALANNMPEWDAKTETSTKPVVTTHLAPTGTAGLHRYHSYHGSQTTGDCTEDADWFVMYDPTGMSEAQLKKLTANMSDSPGGWMVNRAAQDKFGREPEGCPVHHGEPDGAPITAGLSVLSFAIAFSASIIFA